MATHIKHHYREVALPAHIMNALHKDYGFSEKEAITHTLKHMPYIRKAYNAHPVPGDGRVSIIAATVATLRKGR